MAGLLKRFFSHFGSKKGGHESKETVSTYAGFSVKVAVPAHANVPVVSPCHSGEGGVQGLRWYVDGLRTDDDGDVADEFWSEVPTSHKFGADTGRNLSTLELVVSTRPVRLAGPVCTQHGNVHQSVESAGVPLWA
eukprot:TRINITY_DN3389_c0_g1_i2.p1 TRINITY_DN3389_c0_g1~~TRINITY_DN3389_c0_g1_i2.p1  ORF type:complete len:135 (+),score=6.04 TRINITY_DN3389_c0_g1_i2:226-630(+)